MVNRSQMWGNFSCDALIGQHAEQIITKRVCIMCNEDRNNHNHDLQKNNKISRVVIDEKLFCTALPACSASTKKLTRRSETAGA